MIVLTGATGNTGSFVVQHLAKSHGPESLIALVRPGSDVQPLRSLGVRSHVCDFADPETYLPVIEEGATFLGISNIRHCDLLMPHLYNAGISRAHCVTTTAVFSSYHSYSALYREIEARLGALDIPISLLRPSMIYGNDRDHNMKRLIRFLSRTPVFPVFGEGTALMQPVFVEDLARGIATAVERDVTGPYNLAGPEPMTYIEILHEVSGALGRNVRFVHINHRMAAALVQKMEKLPGFPVKHEQVMRLLEDKAFDISRSVKDLDYAPRPFDVGIRQEIAQLQARQD